MPTDYTALVRQARELPGALDPPDPLLDDLADAIEALLAEIAELKDDVYGMGSRNEYLSAALAKAEADATHWKAGVEAYRRFRKAVGTGLTHGAEDYLESWDAHAVWEQADADREKAKGVKADE